MEAPNTADAIISYLAAHDASNFSKLLYNVGTLFNALENPSLSIILAPNDNALQRLSAATGKSLDELQKDPYAIDILANHLSSKPTQKTFPMITSINGNTYGASEKDIRALNVAAFTRIGSVSVLVIGEIIIYPNQVEKASLKRDLGVLKSLQQNDTLFVLIQKGQIKGKDLISFCVADPELNKLCNAKLDFNQLLRRDYNVIAPPGVNPRDYYVKFSTGFKAWTTLVPKKQPLVRNYDDALENSFIFNLQPIDSKVGFVAAAAGASTSVYLTDDGSVYEIKRYILAGQKIPGNSITASKLEGLPKITRVKADGELIVMLGVDESIWVYGFLSNVYVLNRYYTEPDRGPAWAGQPLGRTLVDAAGVQKSNLHRIFPEPTRLDWDNRFRGSKIFDIALAPSRYGPGNLMIILENEKPQLYGDPSVTSVSIESITRSDIIVNTTFGRGPIRRQIIDAMPTIGNWHFLDNLLGGLPITEAEVLKVEGKFILDDQGRLWTNYILPPAGRIQILYAEEPELRFVDVIDGHQGITWVLSEDGRLFTIGMSLAPFMHAVNLSDRQLTLVPGISGIVWLDINPGLESNAALLTKWDQ